jgi:competence protein ComEA
LQPYVVKTDLYDYSLQDSIFKTISADTTYATGQEKAVTWAQTPNKKAKNTAKTNELRPHSININTANQTELERLPRIGPATANNIMEYRRANGNFNSLDELINVKRIGPKTLELIKPYLIIK